MKGNFPVKTFHSYHLVNNLDSRVYISVNVSVLLFVIQTFTGGRKHSPIVFTTCCDPGHSDACLAHLNLCLRTIKAHFQTLSAQAHITDALPHSSKEFSLSAALSFCFSLHLSLVEAPLISSEVIKHHKIKSAASYLAQSPFG